ncbi:MAG: sensor histidine kinase [Gammaproteobacteria bacterium]
MPSDLRDSSDSYLPDFCSGRMVLAVVLIAEFVAIVLSLSQFSTVADFWLRLARASLFLLWVGLGSAALLCAARPWLNRHNTLAASALAGALLLGTTALISILTLMLGQYFFGQQQSSFMQPSSPGVFLFRNMSISVIVSALLLRYFYVTHQWRMNVELQALSRISALQARIRPHFLFNSMNTIASLTRSDPELAEQAVEDLADLFRSSLSDAAIQVRLKEELEMTRIYQRIEALRLGDRLRVVWDVDDLPMRALVPGLCIQPLLENAIYHGIENLPEGGTITISGRDHGKGFDIDMRNPLPPGGAKPSSKSNQIALQNIRQRLELAYDRPAKINAGPENGEYRVTLWIPKVESQR